MKHHVLRWDLPSALDRLGVRPPCALLDTYLAHFERWREGAGLAAWPTPEDVCVAGMIPSLFAAVACRPVPGDKILDLGAGGGIVGLPLAACFPAARVCLVDKKRKHVVFLQHIVPILGLNNVEVRHGRAEQAAGEGGFDLVVARAVDPPTASRDVALRLARPGGMVVRWRRGEGIVQAAVAPGATELAATGTAAEPTDPS